MQRYGNRFKNKEKTSTRSTHIMICIWPQWFLAVLWNYLIVKNLTLIYDLNYSLKSSWLQMRLESGVSSVIDIMNTHILDSKENKHGYRNYNAYKNQCFSNGVIRYHMTHHATYWIL